MQSIRGRREAKQRKKAFVRSSMYSYCRLTVPQRMFTQNLDSVSAKLHCTDTGYGHHQRTSSQQFYDLLYNKFTTNGQRTVPEASATLGVNQVTTLCFKKFHPLLVCAIIKCYAFLLNDVTVTVRYQLKCCYGSRRSNAWLTPGATVSPRWSNWSMAQMAQGLCESQQKALWTLTVTVWIVLSDLTFNSRCFSLNLTFSIGSISQNS